MTGAGLGDWNECIERRQRLVGTHGMTRETPETGRTRRTGMSVYGMTGAD